MKMNTYEAPAFEFLAFQAEDVIRTSGPEEEQMARGVCPETPWHLFTAGGASIDPNA